jgi:membrane protein implicated in regulation of membrane protease activity
MTFIGGEMEIDGDADFDVETDGGAGFQFFTLKNFIGFFTIFAWSGIASLDSGYSTGTTLLISTLSGLFMMTIMASLFYFFSKLTASGTMNINNAKGSVAEVYMRIEAGRGNVGKVLIKVQGSLRELEAITDDDLDLPMGTVVTVTDVLNNSMLLVSKNKL